MPLSSGKTYVILAMLLVALYLLYDGHFIAHSDYDAGFSYGMAAFLSYAVARVYFDQPVFETSGGTILAVSGVLLYVGYGDKTGSYELLVFGAIVGCVGLAIYGMDIKEKELRTRARALGIEELMFPKK
jgi:hypothetical protein